jgi:hypothetical protein
MNFEGTKGGAKCEILGIWTWLEKWSWDLS